MLTLCAWAGFVCLDVPSFDRGGVLSAVYLLFASGLVYGGLVYQVSRLSCLRRMQAHARGARADSAAVAVACGGVGDDAVSEAAVAVLVPSYKEEPGTSRRDPGKRLPAQLLDRPRDRLPDELAIQAFATARRVTTPR